MKSKISIQTLEDLEFNEIRNQIAVFSITKMGKEKILAINPIADKEILNNELFQVNEYLASFENENKIPFYEFENISKSIHLLGIEDSYIEIEELLKIKSISKLTNQLIKFFKKFKDYFPSLHSEIEQIYFTKEIEKTIENKVTPYGTIKDKASENLSSIRKELKKVKVILSGSFNKSLAHYSSLGYLDDIRESVVDNHRVLAVKSMYRRKVKGSILGNSKTGSIVFILPESTLNNVRELELLELEEKDEIIRILKQITNILRPFATLLKQYQNYLVHLDLVSAKANYAKNIHAVLPKITSEKKVFFKDAFHPLLLVSNRENNIETVSQTIELNDNQRIIVISGPNAGGKSITLKTIGLLQAMLQSGILIPVHENSSTYFFERILSDIGDNQSIENQLSTYSYRLKNMRNFLKKCNDNTLFLIDEFGTGSDPELGGALAEVFLEEFYQKNAFGIITTHYANLKVLANELDSVVNANMQFNTRTYEPTFKLQIGQAGSSFTFEVAQKNGIPFSLINKAKKKVEREKIRLDKTISKLQGERNKLLRNNQNLEKQQKEQETVSSKLIEKQEKLQKKIESIQELYDNNQKMLVIGRKINEITNRYFQNNNKKQLLNGFLKWLAIEKSEREKKTETLSNKKSKKKTKTINLQETEKIELTVKNPEKPSKRDLRILKKQKEKEDEALKKRIQETERSILNEVNRIRNKKTKLKKEELEKIKNYQYKIGDKVRIIGSNSSGIIEKIEKNTVFINFGIFITKSNTNKIELV